MYKPFVCGIPGSSATWGWWGWAFSYVRHRFATASYISVIILGTPASTGLCLQRCFFPLFYSPLLLNFFFGANEAGKGFVLPPLKPRRGASLLNAPHIILSPTSWWTGQKKMKTMENQERGRRRGGVIELIIHRGAGVGPLLLS